MADLITYPTGFDYQQALQNTSFAFRDPALRGGDPVPGPLGMPKAISGNFASVFTINGTDGRRWAVKCFTRNVPDQALRYEQVSKTMRGITSHWKVEFQYLTDAVLCQGTWYPVLKMEWVEAIGLLSYVETHLGNQDALADLAEKFGDLVRDLSRHGIAHGDLQHGNILVTPSGELKLIDYDGMFVPELSSSGASELGHANYQSPLRTTAHWGPDIDRFSSWVIYTSLSALALDPTLWQTLHADGDEALLFHQRDFSDHDGSRVRYALANSSLVKLREIAQDIDFLWTPDLAAIPSLETILAPGSPQTVQKPAAYQGSGTGIDWLRQHQSVAGIPADTVSSLAATGHARPIGTAAWLTTHLTSGPRVEFDPPKKSIRITCALLLGLTVLCAAVPALIPLGLLLAMFVWAVTFNAYMFSPEGREKLRSYKVFTAQRHAAVKARNAASAFERTARKLVRQAEGYKSAAERKAEKARADEQREIDSAKRRHDREIKRLDDKLGALQSKENAEVGKELLILQQAYIEGRLQATRIPRSGIPGIGPAIAANLAACGIVTAADIVDVRGSAIVRRNGTLVSPRGVGQQRASTLYGWRLRVEVQARTSQPTVLPQARRQEIAHNYAQQKQSLENDKIAASARAATEENDLRNKWAKKKDDIAKHLQEATTKLAALRVEADPKIAVARKQSETADWQRDFAKRELTRYHRITYRRYIGRLIKG